LATKLRRIADGLAASLDQPQNQREATLRALRISLLRDLLGADDALPEIGDPPPPMPMRCGWSPSPGCTPRGSSAACTETGASCGLLMPSLSVTTSDT
jgi:hypothetical protein